MLPSIRAFLILLFLPVSASAVTHDQLLSNSARIADELYVDRPIYLGWENAPYLSGMVLLGEQMNEVVPGSGDRFLTRSLAAIGDGNAGIWHGDLAAYSQAAMELYRILPSDSPLRAQMLNAVQEPLRFADRSLHATPSTDPPASPWWVEEGYGSRFWQDDLFSVTPGLAMLGSQSSGLPGVERARNIAYEWIEAYVYDHRSADPNIPNSRERNGTFLWDESTGLFFHDPSSIGNRDFWGRGNGWAAYGLSMSQTFLTEPYTGTSYSAVLDQAGVRSLLQTMAETFSNTQTHQGGWSPMLLQESFCPAETSASGLITFMLARGVNEGWLPRERYLPVIGRAVHFLLTRIREDGTVTGIQQGGFGPACAFRDSDDPSWNVAYGVGAILLAFTEVNRFSVGDLQSFDAPAPSRRRPVVRDPGDGDALSSSVYHHHP